MATARRKSSKRVPTTRCLNDHSCDIDLYQNGRNRALSAEGHRMRQQAGVVAVLCVASFAAMACTTDGSSPEPSPTSATEAAASPAPTMQPSIDRPHPPHRTVSRRTIGSATQERSRQEFPPSTVA